MSRGGAVLASLLVTIGRPAWWLLALAAFLVRGGFVVFVLPIVLLPSPLAISNMVAPFIIPVALGRIGADVVLLALVAGIALVGWLIVAGWIAAALELALLREQAAAAAEEGIPPDGFRDGRSLVESASAPRRDRVLIRWMVVTRLVAWLPLGAALVIGTVRIVAITYVELTRPDSVATPLALRVGQAAAPELTAIAVTWLLGELVGGLASRRIVLDGARPGRALLAAAGDVIRRPGSTLLPWLITTLFLLAIAGGAVGAASVSWSRLIEALADAEVDPVMVAINLFLFVAIWLAALDLTAICAAVRGSVQTFEVLHRRSATGTFGASKHHRPGDWSVPDEGGSL